MYQIKRGDEVIGEFEDLDYAFNNAVGLNYIGQELPYDPKGAYHFFKNHCSERSLFIFMNSFLEAHGMDHYKFHIPPLTITKE